MNRKKMETPVQTRMSVNNVNELEPMCRKAVDEITFENSHLVVEYILGKDKKLADALLNELKMQIMLGDKNVRKTS